jgi:hypothetical protein
VLTILPPGLDESARRTGALVRCRNVPNAAALLRMALAYAVTDLSLKDVAAWAQSLQLASITGPGLFYRLRMAEGWLQELLARTLQTGIEAVAPGGMRLRVVDATVVNGPGPRSTDWRVHVVTDPGTGTFKTVEITDEHGAEGYERHVFEAGDVVLGDRMYATAKGVWAVKSAGAEVAARLNPHTIRVCNAKHEVVSLLSLESKVPRVGVIDIDVVIPIPPERRTKSHKTWPLAQSAAWVPARVLAARSRNGELTWVMTTLPRDKATPVQVMDLYRLRWQVELFFKRLKSLLGFDSLPSRQGPTARSWMLCRLLAAALAQRLVMPNRALFPWGYDMHNIQPADQCVVTIPHDPVGDAGGSSG